MKRSTMRGFFAACTSGVMAAATLTVGATLPAVAADEPAPRYTDVSVHDPSVVTSGNDIWIFGSHGASAKSTDLLNWTQHTVDLTQNKNNKLFTNIQAELKEAFDWAESDTLWASDVIQLPNGKYAMYYNACKGDSPRSALGLATSDKVDGPFKNQGILLKSGQWGQESENKGEIYNALVHPNAVDPDAFFDKDGKLWMVYGSYSGGIYILQMDAKTGKPLPNQGYGKHLMGGNHSRIEAPAIQYNKDTGYYYLYTSFGGLDATGGYNMRVARSKNPNGPYVDAKGTAMTSVKSNASKPVFDDATIAPHGVKLMGSHVFTREAGSPGSGSGVGYVSPGHNTWYEDPKTGKMFLIFHSRFPDTGEMHQVRVQQLWFNNDGWPVLSPMRYAGETAGRASAEDVIGQWQVVNHGKEINTTTKKSTTYTFRSGGTITAANSTNSVGTWKISSRNTANITLNGTTFSGVYTPVWDPQYSSWSYGFTALSKDGTSLMGRNISLAARSVGTPDGSWSFEGHLNDGSGKSAAATTTGSRIGTSGGTASYNSGVQGKAAYFNGSTGIRLPDGLIQGNSYTVSMWLKPEALTEHTPAFFGSATTERWVSMVPQGHSGVSGNAMVWAGTTWYDAGTGKKLPLNQWSHVTFVVKNGAVQVYVNGQRTHNGTGFPNVFTTANGQFALGVNHWDTPFKGSIDEVKVWRSALTAADVQALAVK
ncbi:LamG-like jellyroll fold domain-containing protein [Jonesia quinghaiensis]|uniref:LamG-like jellyroll fold domain-containing protein n=1 Tax=Jonesia quinghaiensis TaxID=262806 RepID=UPI00040BF19E|nr:LamG-like jellyroll fold domain-containing protein [Jonesia quinghaiensis]